MVLRVASYDSLEYWMDRLIANQTHSELLRLDPTSPQSLVFRDPEGHEVELMVSDTTDTPLVADADDIPAEHRIRGIEGARSFTTLEEQLPFAEHLGFRADGNRLVLDGERSGRWYFCAPHRPPVAATAASASGTTSPTTPATARRPARPRRGQRGRAPVDEDLRPLLLRLVLLDVARRTDGDLHQRGLGFSSTRSSKTSETDSVSRLEWSRFAPSSKPS